MSVAQSTPFPLRMPEELRRQIADLAKSNNRSMNTEIVLLLQQAFETGSGRVGTASDVDALAEALAAKLVAKLSIHPRD